MEPEDMPRFLRIMRGLQQYYERSIEDDVVMLYWADLQEYQTESVMAAFRAHRRDPDHGRFFPKFADLFPYLERKTSDKALQAWDRVWAAIREVGAYATVDFQDPLIHRVIEDLGGWTHLCAMQVEEAPFRAKDFTDRYKALARPGAPVDAPSSLGGLHEISNGRQFPMWVPPPVAIGPHGVPMAPGVQARINLPRDEGGDHGTDRRSITLGPGGSGDDSAVRPEQAPGPPAPGRHGFLPVRALLGGRPGAPVDNG
jgi:hypothetical protein